MFFSILMLVRVTSAQFYTMRASRYFTFFMWMQLHIQCLVNTMRCGAAKHTHTYTVFFFEEEEVPFPFEFEFEVIMPLCFVFFSQVCHYKLILCKQVLLIPTNSYFNFRSIFPNINFPLLKLMYRI